MKPCTGTNSQVADERLIEALSCRIHTAFEQLAGMQQEWDQFVIDIGGDIYLSYDWCRIWWEHYGAGRSLCVFVYRREKQLVGLIPLFIERIWLGPVWLRIAKVVGSDFTMCMVNPPVKSEYAEEIFGQTIEYLTDTQKCDAVLFGLLTGNYGGMVALRETCGANQSKR